MNFEMKCPHCSAVMEMDEDWIGLEGECPACGKDFVIQKQVNISVEEPMKPKLKIKRDEAIAVVSDTKNCPYCGEEIKIVAKKCKHCNEWLDKSLPVAVGYRPVSSNKAFAEYQTSRIKILKGWNMPVYLLFTLNIYYLFWLYRIFKELNILKVTYVSPGKAVGYLFIPFYNFYWIFAVWRELGEAVKRAYAQADLVEPNTEVTWVVPIAIIVGFFVNIAAAPLGSVIILIAFSIVLWIIQEQMNTLGRLNQHI